MASDDRHLYVGNVANAQDDRVCDCGCGGSLAGRAPNARYTVSCVTKRAYTKRKARGYTPGEPIKSVDPLGHGVWADRHEKNTHEKQTLCPVCIGMSWRREGLCECNEWYAPEPPPERQSALVSSMGTAVREGKLYGYAGLGGERLGLGGVDRRSLGK